jgi:hypothetical protein
MKKMLVALYDDISVARKVVEDLVNADFDRNTISLVTNDSQNHYSHYLSPDYVARDDAVTAGEGAGFGAIVGALTGILVGIAALTIPGIGLALVGGPLLAGLSGAFAGAVMGGVVGALVKSGVPADEAPYYAEGVRRGGTLISIETDATLEAGDIMNRYGAVNIHERINNWRLEGWTGFDNQVVDTLDANLPVPFASLPTPSPVPTPVHGTHHVPLEVAHSKFTPASYNGNPISVEPTGPAPEYAPLSGSNMGVTTLPGLTNPTGDGTVLFNPSGTPLLTDRPVSEPIAEFITEPDSYQNTHTNTEISTEPRSFSVKTDAWVKDDDLTL